mmetsp:Transcript_148662/g.370424  ORF Transcript_148662/g.370424 Transcript_148662/m.370424 type:complete len:87 (+) Transcript_148662:154-414(+)
MGRLLSHEHSPASMSYSARTAMLRSEARAKVVEFLSYALVPSKNLSTLGALGPAQDPVVEMVCDEERVSLIHGHSGGPAQLIQCIT